MSEKRLFVVEITYTGVVMADSDFEADGFSSDIVNNECYPDVVAFETDAYPADWNSKSIVYHNYEDLGDVKLVDAEEMCLKAKAHREANKKQLNLGFMSTVEKK